jgi:hypothetical protein
MTDFKAIFKTVTSNLDKQLEEVAILRTVHQTFGIRPSYIFIGVILIVIALAII